MNNEEEACGIKKEAEYLRAINDILLERLQLQDKVINRYLIVNIILWALVVGTSIIQLAIS